MNLNQFAWAIVAFYRSKSVTPHTEHGVFFEKCMIAISSRDMSEYFDTVLEARQFIKKFSWQYVLAESVVEFASKEYKVS